MLRLGEEVADAIAEHRPVVALESTIFSTLGLPAPHNREAIDRCRAAVRAGGAVPAVTAVIDGEPLVGVDDGQVQRILEGGRKVAERDIAVAVSQRWAVGVTTVSASLALAAAAGVEVFATGGIGGVHRGAERTGDVSADLSAIGRHRVVTVSAGAKAFLDLPRTLEYLETASVPVLGWDTDRFPAFYTRDSGCAVPHRVESAAEVASIFATHGELGGGGLLLAVPIPAGDELDSEAIDDAIAAALEEAERRGVSGPDVTPLILHHIGEVTDGDSVPANLALAEHNAAVAAEVASAMVGGR